MKFEDINPELQEKAKACKTPEDILALAKEEGYELSNEELEAMSGGGEWVKRCNDNTCPYNAPMR
ncbi:MAG: Nif11-like leader peptide family natural product precursor [Eggerthellaceae bacterium]|nr:Nif11-like leader peptide family natural product precursor [Eggerthellaceae bacterium]